jgi:predicted nucleic acid-binding Zn ribbon protein
METNKCLQCATPIQGRSDKKFCDDYCRNVYNNRQYAEEYAFVKHVHHILKRNRKILENLIARENNKIRISRNKLADLGFNFRFHTHIQQTHTGKLYFFCYEYGYQAVDQQALLLVKRAPDV